MRRYLYIYVFVKLFVPDEPQVFYAMTLKEKERFNAFFSHLHVYVFCFSFQTAVYIKEDEETRISPKITTLATEKCL